MKRLKSASAKSVGEKYTRRLMLIMLLLFEEKSYFSLKFAH